MQAALLQYSSFDRERGLASSSSQELTLASQICRPEFLSRGDGLATTYDQAYRTTVDGWNAVSPHFREVSSDFCPSAEEEWLIFSF